MKKLLLSLIFAFTTSLFAECVYGAKDKTSFVILDSHSTILKGGYGSDILIKTYCFMYSSSDVQILKDDFCSYDSAVMYIDSEVCDANQVKKL